jgi:hypothetical protein
MILSMAGFRDAGSSRSGLKTFGVPGRIRLKENILHRILRAVIPRHLVSPFGEPDDRLLRGIQYAAASRFRRRHLWKTGSPAFAAMTVMDRFVVLLLHKELSSSGLTGRSSTPRLLDSITGVSGILGRPVKPGDDDCGCGALVFIATDSIFKQPDVAAHHGEQQRVCGLSRASRLR